jgi:DNA polymerase III delta subunit
MKIFVIHGDDTAKSYERLTKFTDSAKERSWEISYLDESEAPIEENLSNASLFGAERFFILRDFRRLGKKETTWINKRYADLSGNFIIYHEGVLNQTFLKSLPKDTKIEEFKLPVLIWNFLDTIVPGSSLRVIKQFYKIIETEPVEFIFTLVARQIRDLYWVKVDPKSFNLPSWRLSKLKSQSSKFTEEQLASILNRMSEIDVEVKTGKADLVSSLDLVILKQLE